MPFPHFIGIGQMKAGTGWLWDQLNSHSQIWVTPKKELHFFNNGFNFDKARQDFRQYLGGQRTNKYQDQYVDNEIQFLNTSAEANAKVYSDLAFFRRALLSKEARQVERRMVNRIDSSKITLKDMNWYRTLFSHTELLTGEITPAYSILERRMVRKIVRSFPDTKFILMLRCPFDRALSHIQHELRIISHGIDENTAIALRNKYLDQIDNDSIVITKSGIKTLNETWLDEGINARILVVHFRDIVCQPALIRSQLSDFLGVSNSGYRISYSMNRKSEYVKYEIPTEVKCKLKLFLDDDIRQYSYLEKQHKIS